MRLRKLLFALFAFLPLLPRQCGAVSDEVKPAAGRRRYLSQGLHLYIAAKCR